MQSIDRFLEKNKTNKLKIAIIADSVIDEYFDVKVTRISPEFPTQIMLSNDWHPTKTMPGGGANTALQMSNGFNVKAFLLSFIDKRAFRIFSSQPFNCDYSVALEQKDIHMPLKRRFYDGDYPLPRWDIESPNYGLSDEKLKEAQDGLLARFKLLLSEEKIDIVVLSDYGKGIFSGDLPQQIINLCNENNIKTLVDPKNPPVERWRNCSYFKPNAFEACKMTDLPAGNWHKHAEKLKNYNIKNTIITDGPNQPYFNLEQPLQLARIPNKQSVIGAGDCMCAFLAVMFRFKEVGIKFNGNFPRNNDAARVFIESGFLYRLFDNDSHKTIYKINEKHQFITQDEDGKFDQKLINNHIVPEVTSFIWGAERRCPGLYPILLELIDNTKAHASEIKNGTERWWLSINHDQQNKKVSFVFLDYGIGIFTSLERKSDDNFHKRMINQVQKIVGSDAHEKYLEKIVDVGGKSSTGLKNRGLGIRGIKLASDRNQINNLVILSNHALGNVSSGQYIRTRNDFNGTLYFWELCYNNENLDNL
jgi:hypothetical protein